MILLDVNVLVYAHRQEAADHDRYRDWLQQVVDGRQAYGLSDLVLSGLIRIVTHGRIFTKPSTIRQALRFAEQVRSRPHCVVVHPGPRHWEIFASLCRETAATGNLVPDAYLAALAIESGSTWITTDRDYARFEGLRWRHPLSD